MFSAIRFGCTSLVGTGKKGVLKPDNDGYYSIVVGALNVYNSAGQYYVYEEAKELFTSSSQLMRRIKRGVLRGEYGHPKRIPGMSDEQFAARIMSIYEENTCCHHAEITLDFENVRDENGNKVIGIVSKVLPSGPKGAALQKSLDNPKENVCFSIRAFTDDYTHRGIDQRILRNIVTWDYVTEPGISSAEKFKSPALEELSATTFTRGQLERTYNQSSLNGVATESVTLSLEELFESFGWQTHTGTSVLKAPGYSGW